MGYAHHEHGLSSTNLATVDVDKLELGVAICMDDMTYVMIVFDTIIHILLVLLLVCIISLAGAHIVQSVHKASSWIDFHYLLIIAIRYQRGRQTSILLFANTTQPFEE